MGRITAGAGYDYLTRDVATSRHDYYTGKGEAPGVWSGRGAALLELAGEVDADDMAALYGRFVDPRTVGGVRLPSGRMQHETVLGRKVSVRTRADGSVSEPIAAFDVTFSPSKSVSVLWATASDERVRNAVVAAHERAVAVGLDYLEDFAGHTRAGVAGVRRVAGEGLIIAQFRHRTARSTSPTERIGDPQLHSHCAILNRVCDADGTWRTLDSKAIYRHAHAAGALYAATLERELQAQLGVSWVATDDRVPMRDISDIPDAAIARWSSRRHQLLARFDELLDSWWQVHGRSPTRDERAAMMDRATLESRRPKTKGDVDLHEHWRAELSPSEQACIDAAVRAEVPSDGGRLPAVSQQLTVAVFDALHDQRAWWNRAHVFAEIARLVDTATREVIEVEVERFIAGCIALEPDDDDMYAEWDASKFTSKVIIDAERRVLDATSRPAEWRVAAIDGDGLGDDQLSAVEGICAGESVLTTVIGPAGSGKTTMLRAAAESYRAAGRDVVVLALSAAAARVVTEETGLPATTIAAWKVGQIKLPRGGLVLVDEASMVPTLILDQVAWTARAHRSRIALVGDYAQMGAPEAGGLLRDLAATPTARQMVAVRRFRQQWERDASIRLRERDSDVVADYLEHGRLVEVITAEARDRAVDAWYADHASGLDTLIVVDTNQDAFDVAGACQARLVAAELVGERVGAVAGRGVVHVGDLIQTRDNTRELATSDGERVLNREVWRVTGVDGHGRVLAVHTRQHGRRVAITPEYAAEHVVLAYATTLAGAQGRTTDTGHVLVTPRTTAQALYVGMTRGRQTNHAHVIVDRHDHDEFALGDRTLEAAFRSAVTREPESQLSATTVARRWADGERARLNARVADRQRQLVVNWWRARQTRLPLWAPLVLRGHHEAVIQLMIGRPTTSWDPALAAAMCGIDWTENGAGERFLKQLATAVAGSIAAPVATPPAMGRGRGVGR